MSPVEFGIATVAGHPAVVATCVWRRDASVVLDGEEVAVTGGSRMRLFFSLRFTPDEMRKLAVDHGWHIGAEFVDPGGAEGVWLLLPAEGSAGDEHAGDRPHGEDQGGH